MEAYHDDEWGVPLHSDNGLFELLTLEGAQAGLSWSTILRRRAGYRRAFADFDINAVAGFSDPDVARLLEDSGIIRHRQKVASTLQNARRIQAIQRELGSFDQFVWSFVAGQPVVHAAQTLADVPTQTPESVALSKALRQRGFGFVGPTICYAFMQACGLVNDHVVTCPRFAELTR
jgi:DNA-3-methyladenine glycosylase I